MSRLTQSSTARRLAAAVVLPLVLALGVAGCGLLGADTKVIRAQFTHALGLFEGNNVDVLGVPIGTVTKVEPKGSYVLVEMEIPSDVKIPAGASALIVPPAIVSDRYVELAPAYTSGPTMEDGAVIPRERTKVPVDFDRVIKALDELAAQLSGDKQTTGALGDAISVAADNLQGNGERLHETVQQLSGALATTSESRDDIIALVRNLDSLTETFAQNDATIRAFSNDVTDVTAQLAADRDELAAAFDALTDALVELARFVQDNRGTLRNQVKDLTVVTNSLVEHQRSLAETLNVFPLALQNVDAAVNPKDNRARVRLPITDSLDPDVFLKEVCGTLPLPICSERTGDDTQDLGLGLEQMLREARP